MVVVGAPGIVTLDGMVLMVVIVVVAEVGEVTLGACIVVTVSVVVMAETVVTEELAAVSGIVVGFGVGLVVGAAIGGEWANLPVVSHLTVGDVEEGLSVVMLDLVMIGGTEVTTGEVWVDKGWTGGIEDRSDSMIDVGI